MTDTRQWGIYPPEKIKKKDCLFVMNFEDFVRFRSGTLRMLLRGMAAIELCYGYLYLIMELGLYTVSPFNPPLE